METARHIEAIDEAGALLAAAASGVSLDSKVPSCPDWDMRELVRHQGGIHRWAANIVATPRTEFWNVDLPEVVGGWPDDDDLVAWFRDGCRDLVGTLRQAPADLECWTFLAAPSPKAMWARRQAHETTIHRVDAEQAAGSGVTPIDAGLAADGIDELLSCFITRRGSRLNSEIAQTLAVVASDVDDRWLVTITPDAPTTERHADGTAACAITGRAEDLYLTLWSRASGDESAIELRGDASVIGLFADAVHIRWS